MPLPVKNLGDVCHEFDHQHHRCAEQIKVSQVEGTTSAHYLSKLAIDADGAPRAYHPADRAPRDNTAKAFDWLANINVNDLHGIQGQGGAVGPAPGFFISATSLSNPAFPHNDTRRYVDASVIPYVVLPKSTFPAPPGTTLKSGCVVFVVDTTTGGSTGAIFADVGRAVGEGSIALALRLGLDPFISNLRPKLHGFDGKRFFYLVFPEVVVAPPWPLATIQDTANAQFQNWGGEAQLKALFPAIPDLRPPVEQQDAAPLVG